MQVWASLPQPVSSLDDKWELELRAAGSSEVPASTAKRAEAMKQLIARLRRMIQCKFEKPFLMVVWSILCLSYSNALDDEKGLVQPTVMATIAKELDTQLMSLMCEILSERHRERRLSSTIIGEGSHVHR